MLNSDSIVLFCSEGRTAGHYKLFKILLSNNEVVIMTDGWNLTRPRFLYSKDDKP